MYAWLHVNGNISGILIFTSHVNTLLGILTLSQYRKRMELNSVHVSLLKPADLIRKNWFSALLTRQNEDFVVCFHCHP